MGTEYHIDLQSKLDERISMAREFVSNRIDANKLIHLSRQPSYLKYPTDISDGLDQFLFYRSCSQQIDNDVSIVAFVVYLAMHSFLDEGTLRRQSYHDDRSWTTIVYDQKLICSSTSEKILGNRRSSRDDFAGDACTSLWTPLRNHVNHAIKQGIEDDDPDTKRLVELIFNDRGKNRLVGWDAFERMFTHKDSGEEFIVLIRKHISPACLFSLELSDTVGNMMLCPLGNNTPRSNWGKSDTAEYFLVHVYKYYETGDVRFLNRLFAAAGNKGRYVEYASLDDVPEEPNYAANAFLGMIARAKADTWEKFVEQWCFRSFCVEWDVEMRPMDMRTGRPFEWDGEAFYDVSTNDFDEDVRMFSNLNDCLIKRNAEIAEMISGRL